MTLAAGSSWYVAQTQVNCEAKASRNLIRQDFEIYLPRYLKHRRHARCRRGDCSVATTVIEVGVDVPEATVMVIEHAERFGLAQLHQLRGRVGRGARALACLLLYKPPLGETAKARLAIMRETEDGFRIAEEDLRLRGEGDVLGTRQSGMPGLPCRAASRCMATISRPRATTPRSSFARSHA